MASTEMSHLEIGLGLVLGVIIGIYRWREWRWRRTPLGQAELAFERTKQEREQRARREQRWRGAP
jgi:hypothetical protein